MQTTIFAIGQVFADAIRFVRVLRTLSNCYLLMGSQKVDNHKSHSNHCMATTITKHLEYIAELEAQLHGSPYYAVAENTVAIAKRVLETELVRLDETAETTLETDTWTSQIKTLEWLVKLPTMSLTFKTFKSVLEHVELVQLFLKLTDIDPSANDNYAIRKASENGHAEVVKALLADPRVNPSAEDNSAICMASEEGHTDVVKVLLADSRVNPSADKNYAIRLASANGHTEVVKLLFVDERVNPSARDNYAVCSASVNGHVEVVKVLLANHRVNPSTFYNSAIRLASENGHTDIVKLLLADSRVDPSAEDNSAICMASEEGHTDVVKVLLADARVDPSAEDNYAICKASENGHTDIVKMHSQTHALTHQQHMTITQFVRQVVTVIRTLSRCYSQTLV